MTDGGLEGEMDLDERIEHAYEEVGQIRPKVYSDRGITTRVTQLQESLESLLEEPDPETAEDAKSAAKYLLTNHDPDTEQYLEDQRAQFGCVNCEPGQDALQFDDYERVEAAFIALKKAAEQLD